MKKKSNNVKQKQIKIYILFIFKLKISKQKKISKKIFFIKLKNY